jgi:hypothetical protein
MSFAMNRSSLIGAAVALLVVQTAAPNALSATTDPAISNIKVEVSTNTLVIEGRRLYDSDQCVIRNLGSSFPSATMEGSGQIAILISLHVYSATANEILATFPDGLPASNLPAGAYTVTLAYSNLKITGTVEVGRTYLLFPFVVYTEGLDTGIAISNVTADPFGHTTMSGTCTFTWYSSTTAPPGILGGGGYGDTSPIAAGRVSSFTASVNLPSGYVGYGIAVCPFKAQGAAFVSDLGMRNLAFSVPAIAASSASDLPWLR